MKASGSMKAIDVEAWMDGDEVCTTGHVKFEKDKGARYFIVQTTGDDDNEETSEELEVDRDVYIAFCLTVCAARLSLIDRASNTTAAMLDDIKELM